MRTHKQGKLVELFTRKSTSGEESRKTNSLYEKAIPQALCGVRSGRTRALGVSVDHVNLGGNSDTVGMHKLQKIASLIEFMRNFLVLFGMPMSYTVGNSIRNGRIDMKSTVIKLGSRKQKGVHT